MATHKITTKHIEGMTLKTFFDEGELVLDVPNEEGGHSKGLRPKQLMLSSLSGCTGMDVVSLLAKMKVKFDAFEVNVTATITDQHPKYYTRVWIDYVFTGAELNENKIKRAVELSFDKYCGVIYMFKQFSDVTYKIVYKKE